MNHVFEIDPDFNEITLTEPGEDVELMHRGVAHDDNPPGRGSGRFGWGTGKNAYQRYKDALTRIAAERRDKEPFTDPNTGKTYYGDTAIARRMGMSSTEFRVFQDIAKGVTRPVDRETAMRKRYEEGKSLDQVAKEMGFANDSSVRALLRDDVHERKSEGKKISEYMKTQIDKNGLYDIGTDAAISLGCSQTKLAEAVAWLKAEGYQVYKRGIPQATNPGKQINTKIIGPPGTKYGDVYHNEIHFFKNDDTQLINHGDKIKKAFEYPASLDPSRLMIRYADDKVSGKVMDGVVEIRRGVDDISLKNNDGVDSHYAQVRVLVGGTHFIKGMAVYSDGKDWPKGVDMVFNTNKSSDVPMMGEKDNSVLKPIKKDPENPFGALIKEHGGQSYYTDENGEQHLRLINKKSDEGDWNEWSKTLSAQFLSKQHQKTIDQQLSLTIADKELEFEKIKSLTNPTVKKQQLMSFAEDCDSNAAKLHAVGFKGQRYQVILPLRTISDREVYAPNFQQGSKVALVRFPHEGTFQIPICTVNNKNPEGDKVITKNAKDAIGVSSNTAEKMSGADFDGDTVLVIPITARANIASRDVLKDLEGFDAKTQYGPHSPGSIGRTYKHLSKEATQREMGEVSNLISDMTLRGADFSQIARAVKYSNTVIDADKHNLDYKRCYKEMGIRELKNEFQGHYKDNGRYSTAASTLITRAHAEARVDKREGQPKINIKGKPYYDPTRPEGVLLYKTASDKKLYYEEVKVRKDKDGKKIRDPETGKPIYDKTGKILKRQEKLHEMDLVDDARKLISPFDTSVERSYADFANRLKSLANEARKEYVATPNLKKNPSAAKVYAKEVKYLEDWLKLAQANKPREKQAQYITNQRIKVIKDTYDDLDKKDLKKKQDQILRDARLQVGAKRVTIPIGDREWEAIQNGAISDNKLKDILKYADKDNVRERAMPKKSKSLTASQKARIKQLVKNKYITQAELANMFGVSVSTISNIVNE